MTGVNVHIPTLETDRLTLRGMRIEDFDRYAEMLVSPRAKYMDANLSPEMTWWWFQGDVAGWTLFGTGALMIDRRDTGETVGQVGINKGPKYPETELGWMLYDGHEGHGYATEAAEALRRWAYDTHALPPLVSYVDAANEGSIRVAERLGAVPDADAPRPDPEDLVYRHPSREALA